MKNKPDANILGRRAYINISLVFLFLAVSLQALVWLYWNKVLEPRLHREATSQANVLAHSQAAKIADALMMDESSHQHQVLDEILNEILLFTDPENNEPIFRGLDLEIDYDVIPAPTGSLDLKYGEAHCQSCFLSEVALYSPVSDELIGITRFRVSASLFQRLSTDVHQTLFTQSHLSILLLLIVWGVVMYLIGEINRSRHQAETASRAKSSFLANMSHELRTPLNAIIGFSDLMRRDRDFLPKYKENLSIISRSGEYLLELINDVLELSKIEASQDTLMESTFDLYDTLDKVTEMIGLRAEKNNLQLVFERSENLPRYITMDERKLRQILLNLLGNAVKFTEEGGVTLRVRQDSDKQNMDSTSLVLHFEVEDSGPGIASGERAKMFDAFTQTKSGYDKKEGSGLGLAISRQFVQYLGGEITVSSTVGQGTVFEFTVLAKPAMGSDIVSHQPTHRVIGLESSRKSGNKTYRILVVDDHPDNRTLLRLLLEQVGFLVKTAKNGLQAVELSKSWHPHLIWMDMRMPVMDGYEATKTIQQTMCDKTEKHPVIIALTASAFKEDRDAVLAAGCDDFVRRPFRQSEIFTKIQKHLGVDYIYETADEASLRNAQTDKFSTERLRAEIALLPKYVITELYTAIELSDMEQMDQLIAKISGNHSAVADELKELVDTFQYDHILSLLDVTKDTTVENTGGVK